VSLLVWRHARTGVILTLSLAFSSCSGTGTAPPLSSAGVAVAAALSQLADKSIWSIVPSPNASPNDGDLYDDLLYNASGDSPSDVWTVGWSCCDSQGSQENDRTLIEHWNGSAWAIVPSASGEPTNNQLRGVATIDPNDAWAFGNSFDTGQPLIEHWDGKKWSLSSSPSEPNGWLWSGLAFSKNNVWAAGTGGFAALVEHWDGHQWSAVQNASGSGPSGSTYLSALSASGPNDIWTVGETDRPDPNVFSEHWNGNKLTFVKPVNHFLFSLFYAVASVSASDVWAVGYEAASEQHQQLRTLIEHWNGSKWSVVPSPNEGPKSPNPLNNVLSAVVALSADDVWAAGYWTSADSNFRALFEHWDGKTWKIEPGPPGLEKNGNGSFSQIMGFARLSGNTTWATGYQSKPDVCCDETLTLNTTHG
jgi:hypothetical protein